MQRKIDSQPNQIAQVYIDDVECSICTEIVGNTVSEYISGIGILGCGHVFCLKCITEYKQFKIVTQGNELIECPKCRTQQKQIFDLQFCSADIREEVVAAVEQAKIEQKIRGTKIPRFVSQTSSPLAPISQASSQFFMPRLPLGPPMSGDSHMLQQTAPMMPMPQQYLPQNSTLPTPSVTQNSPQMGRIVKERKHPFWVHHYCEICRSSFGMIGMRYHCAVCRRVVCSSCSRTHPLHNIAQHGLSNRVCRECFV